MKTKIFVALLLLTSCEQMRVPVSRYTIEVPRGQYVDVYYTNDKPKIENGCISFINVGRYQDMSEPVTVCGTYIIK